MPQPDTLQCFLHSGVSVIPFRNSFSLVKQEFSLLLLLRLLSKPLYAIKYQVSSYNRALLMNLCILSRIVPSKEIISGSQLLFLAFEYINIQYSLVLPVFNQRNWTRLCQQSAFIIKYYTIPVLLTNVTRKDLVLSQSKVLNLSICGLLPRGQRKIN